MIDLLRRNGSQIKSDLIQLARNRSELNRTGMAYYNFWDVGAVRQSWLYRFWHRPALKGLFEQRSIGIYSVFGRRRVLKFSQPEIKLFVSGENLESYPEYQDYGGNLIDLSLGFDTDSPAKNHLRFPLWLLTCFPPEASLQQIKDMLEAWETRHRENTNSILGATLLARHDHHGSRSIISDIVEAQMPVIYPGIFRKNTDTVLYGYNEKISFISNYQFNICPENADGPGYVTEKIFHAFMAGCIPVYYGSGNSPEPTIINPEAIVFYDHNEPSKLSKTLNGFMKDASLRRQYAEQPYFLPLAAENIYETYLRLERKIKQLYH